MYTVSPSLKPSDDTLIAKVPAKSPREVFDLVAVLVAGTAKAGGNRHGHRCQTRALWIGGLLAGRYRPESSARPSVSAK